MCLIERIRELGGKEDSVLILENSVLITVKFKLLEIMILVVNVIL
jgi:hypothetical protein